MTTPHTFPLLGEPLALDLVNTRVRREGVDTDLLDRPAALDGWLRAEASRVDWSGRARPADLAAVRALRDAVDPLLRAHVAGGRGPIAAIRGLNGALVVAGPQTTLAWGKTGPRKVPPVGHDRLAALLRQLAASALELLTGPDSSHLRRCAHPDCVLLFVARDPRRRWCSDAICGNRARVARHYLRHRRVV
ncbi:MAG: CGNR zinc finger domain-containing protein [Rhodanobacteraceae bacterium]